MLNYWVLRRSDGKPVGLVRVQDDCALLKLSAPVEAAFTLFSESGAVPVVPESEVHLPGAEALLGTENDRVICFAAASDAHPASHYRNRLSQIYTKESEPMTKSVSEEQTEPDLSLNSTINDATMPEKDKNAEDISRNYTIDTTRATETAAETARDTESFSMLLTHANAFYEAYEANELPTVDDMVQKKDNQTKPSNGIDLFPQEFPGAHWRYVDGTDVLSHFEGTWRQPNGPTLHILAVRGRAAPRPPRTLFGFTRFLRDRDGTGYWLKCTPLP